MTVQVLDPGAAVGQAIPGARAAWAPAVANSAQLLTPATLMAAALRGVPGLFQVIETFSDGLCTVVVVVDRTARDAVEPIYRAEIAVAEALPKSRFVVRPLRADSPLDATEFAGVTQSFPLA